MPRGNHASGLFASYVCGASFSRHQMTDMDCVEPRMLYRWWCIPPVTNNNPNVSLFLHALVCLGGFLLTEATDSQKKGLHALCRSLAGASEH